MELIFCFDQKLARESAVSEDAVIPLGLFVVFVGDRGYNQKGQTVCWSRVERHDLNTS